ncbi:YidC/Oxa1 family membrane protein insertase, partial [Chloroflexota bacterium]
MGIGEIWNLIALQPVINILIMLTHYLFSSFGLAIIALTVVVNVSMYPLTMKQIKATQAMQSLQPKLAELQKKYG